MANMPNSDSGLANAALKKHNAQGYQAVEYTYDGRLLGEGKSDLCLEHLANQASSSYQSVFRSPIWEFQSQWPTLTQKAFRSASWALRSTPVQRFYEDSPLTSRSIFGLLAACCTT